MLIRDLKVKISRDEVFKQIECYEESSVYAEVERVFEEIKEEIYGLCEPVFLLENGTSEKEFAGDMIPEGTPVLFALCSIGEKISEYSANAFENGEYLKGMLADAMADSALFSLEQEAVPFLKEACADIGMGIEKRLEAPKDIPIEMQKVVLEKTRAEELCGIQITSGYMLNPVKSNAFIYVLTDDEKVFQYQHDCRNCEKYDCKMRKVSDVPVTIITDESQYIIHVKERQNILGALMKEHPSFSAVCGGTGTCAKCKIQVLKGRLPVTVSDESCFSEEELAVGMRLACKAYPTEALEVRLMFRDEASFVALGSENSECDSKREISEIKQEDQYAIAVDLGTTTIAMQLLSLQTGEVCGVYTCLNHQRRFGADVISRIKASNEGKKDELQKSIQEDLQQGFLRLLKQSSVVPKQVKEILVAGNTTMGHLLMGYDCNTLGAFPFSPVNIKIVEESYENIFKDDLFHAKVKLLPGISAFVGADIVAGIYHCGMHKNKEYSLLIDLGTNGEIVLGNADKMFATATAAGPAFEGGNIKCGIGSIEGAISSAQFVNGKIEVQTIDGKFPIGICGTGVLEIVAELLQTGLIDETGLLDEEYFDEGCFVAKSKNGEHIVLTQKDIREIQMAKAAIRAGVETLIAKCEILKDDIAHVYLAGGFGVKLNCKKAIAIGLLPKEFENKIKAVGNSSLQGTAKVLLSDEHQELAEIIEKTEEINLAGEEEFNQNYVDFMHFK